MKIYTLEQLSRPETYKADGDLFGMALGMIVKIEGDTVWITDNGRSLMEFESDYITHWNRGTLGKP